MTRAERARRSQRAAFVKSGDWMMDTYELPAGYRFRRDAPKPCSSKVLPAGRHVALLPQVGDRWALVIKHVETGRISTSPATYATPAQALRAGWDWVNPPAGTPAAIFTDEEGVPLGDVWWLKPAVAVKETER